MNIDNHRAWAGKPLRRQVEEAGDIAAIERLTVDQFRLAEVFRIEAAGFTRGPALEQAFLDVDRINVRWIARRAEAEPEIAAVTMPLEPGDHAARQGRQRQVLVRICV